MISFDLRIYHNIALSSLKFDRFRKLFQPDILEIMQYPGVILAGGALRSMIRYDEPVKDYDFFFNFHFHRIAANKDETVQTYETWKNKI